MAGFYRLKAEPAHSLSKWEPRERSLNRRSFFAKAMASVLLVVVFCAISTKVLLYGGWHLQFLEPGWLYHGSGEEPIKPSGSQYLLGVGKADITGY